MSIFPRRQISEISQLVANVSIDQQTHQQSREIVETVRQQGDTGLRRLAHQFDDLAPDDQLLLSREQLHSSLKQIDDTIRSVLENTCRRVQTFARKQLESLSEISVPVSGGRAGHTIEPIRCVGCYAPGGRFPLPSSVIMTAAVANIAGCEKIIVASPRPSPVVQAAAYLSGADYLMPIGGAQAIAALAFGTSTIPRADMIAGPGNRWVTAAKQIVFGHVGVDMLAGPSELLVLADDSANPAHVATDLLAQAEHDVDARTFLVSLDADLVAQVEIEIQQQLSDLPTSEVARRSLQNGGSLVVSTIDQAIDIVESIAPEHLELQCRNATDVSCQIKNAGCVFIGPQTAEVFGDYGIGPNHTLPTGTTARFRGGLSVFDFVRIRSWIQLDESIDPAIQNEMALLAKTEGLIGHQRSVEIKR